MISEKQQIFILGLIAFAVWIARRLSENETPTTAVNSIFSGCEFDTPGHYRPITGHSHAPKWCIDSKPEKLIALTNHMKLHCKSDVCVAPEFGSHIAHGYIRSLGLAMTNPSKQQLTSPASMIECEFETYDGKIELQMFQSPVQVRFIDEHGMWTQVLFKNKGACLAQSLMSKL